MCGKVVGLRLHGVCKAPRLEGFWRPSRAKIGDSRKSGARQRLDMTCGWLILRPQDCIHGLCWRDYLCRNARRMYEDFWCMLRIDGYVSYAIDVSGQ